MFNRIIVKFTAAALAAAAGLFGAAAYATPITSVTATASILDMTLTRLTISNYSYLVDASTPFFADFDVALTPFSFSTSNASGVSLAQIDNTFDPLPGTHAAAERTGEGHASVLWSFDWIATSTGRASILLDYLYDATIQGLKAGDGAVARSYASLTLDGSSLFDSALYYLNGVEGSLGDFRTLGLSFDVLAGQTGAFTVALASDAIVTVPEPSGLSLLACAMAGMIFIRRRYAV